MRPVIAPVETARELGRYRLIAVLGQGGSGRVYLAVSRGPAGFNKLLVVKELRPELEHDPEFLTMFLDEARLSARLNHPNVVQTYEVGCDGQAHFIAMEYLEGQPLSSLLRNREPRLPTELQLKILSTALLGLHYAHELCDFDGTPLGVVHRDVSPQNVFVTYDGQVKIVDFGIAKAAGAISQTRTGVIKGKLRYMAPEQLCARPVDRRTDIFSCGVMLWEALAGKRIGDGKTDTEIAQQRMLGTEPHVRDDKPDVPGALAAICDRAMAIAPEDRYSTAAELHRDLEEAIEAVYGRVTSNQIAALVCENFGDERKQLRALVDAQIKQAASLPPTEFPNLAMLDVGDETVRPKKISLAASLRPTGPPALEPAEDSFPATTPPTANLSALKQRRPAWSLWLGLVTLGFAFTGVATAFLARSPTTASEVLLPATALPPTAASVVPDRTIKVNVSASPRGASLHLDESPLASNPFRATVSRDTKLHRIRASLAGYDTAERTVAFESDVDIVLELTEAHATPAKVSNPRAKTKQAKAVHSPVIDDRDPYTQ
jgi:eukaryotic-like serine/threonine-protein kinase